MMQQFSLFNTHFSINLHAHSISLLLLPHIDTAARGTHTQTHSGSIDKHKLNVDLKNATSERYS